MEAAGFLAVCVFVRCARRIKVTARPIGKTESAANIGAYPHIAMLGTKFQGVAMVFRLLFCVYVVSAFFSASASAGISDDLVFCSRLKVGQERLACYDAAARLEKKLVVQAVSPPTRVSPSGSTSYAKINAPPKTWTGFFVGLGAVAERVKSENAGTLTSNPGGDTFVSVGGETVSH